MIKKFTTIFLAVFVLALGSCVQDDLDNLQDQIDDLNEKVTELEGEQLAAMQTSILAMQTLITNLQNKNTEQAGQYQALLDNLTALETEIDQEIANLESEIDDNKSAIFYGNLISDEDFQNFETQGASIATGRVVVSSNAQAALIANLETVGGSFSIHGGTTIEVPMLKTVAGDVVISGVSDTATVVLPMLSIAGANLIVENSAALTSFTTPALTFVANDLSIIGYDGKASALATLDLAGASVMGDVTISGTYGADIELGNLGGSLSLMYLLPGKLIVGSENIGGDLHFEFLGGDFTELDFSNLKTIEGSLLINNNSWSPLGDGIEEGITSIAGVFSTLETIGASVNINANLKLVDLDDFNNVMTIGENNPETTEVYIKTETPTINIFNNVMTVGKNDDANITVFVDTEVASVFSELTTPGNRWGSGQMNITLVVAKYEPFVEGGGGIGIGSVATGTANNVNFDGFGKVTLAKGLIFDASQCDGVTSTVTAFEEVTNLNFFQLNFSVEGGNFTFTGLNKLTASNGSSNPDIDNILKVNKGEWNSDYTGPSNLNVTLDIFESLTEVNYLTLDYQVHGGGNYNVDFKHGVPSTKYGAKLVLGRIRNETSIRPICAVPGFKAIVDKYVEGNTIPSTFKYKFKMYQGRVDNDYQIPETPSSEDRIYDNYVVTDYLTYLMADTCNQ